MAEFDDPRAAYLHVPFCRHHCGYCNFTVVEGREDLIEAFLEAISTELSWLDQPRPVDTLYFGGGTPTHLPADRLQQLCELALHWHPLEAGYEWTVEANPGDLDEHKVQLLSDFGVTRISLGAQSFNDHNLSVLERDHQAADIQRAVENARSLGMQVSLDLIFAVPGETLADWEHDLHQAIALEPDHVSTYGLTFEKGTRFFNRLSHGNLQQAPEELEREMYVMAIQRLAAAGFEHYEISNFAQPGRRSRHNEVYWSGASYYAAGPGASRYVLGVRETNHRSTTTYLRRVLAIESPVEDRESLEPESRARELLVFSLRRLAGIDRQSFHSKTGRDLDDLAGTAIAKFVDHELLSDDGTTVRLTTEGLMVSDSMWPELL